MAKRKKQELTGKSGDEWKRVFWSDIADQHDYIKREIDKDLSGLRDREIKSWPIVELSETITPHPAQPPILMPSHHFDTLKPAEIMSLRKRFATEYHGEFMPSELLGYPIKYVDRGALTGRKFKRPYTGMYEVSFVPEEHTKNVADGFQDMIDGNSEIYHNLTAHYPLGELPLSFVEISPSEFWYCYGYEDAMEELFFDQLSRDE